jgi:hypothetical protein
VEGSCEHDEEPSGFIKEEEFFHCLRDYFLLNKDMFQGVSYLVAKMYN